MIVSVEGAYRILHQDTDGPVPDNGHPT